MFKAACLLCDMCGLFKAPWANVVSTLINNDRINAQFLSSSVFPALLRSMMTLPTWAMCHVGDDEKFTMLSKFTNLKCYLTADSMTSTVR